MASQTMPFMQVKGLISMMPAAPFFRSGLGAVEVEVADGDAAQVAAQLGIDGFADDAVHAGEGADIDDAGRAFLQIGIGCRRSRSCGWGCRPGRGSVGDRWLRRRCRSCR